MEDLWGRDLPFLFFDFDISYEGLLFKIDRFIMSVKQLKPLCIEIYKTLHSPNSNLMKKKKKKEFTS